MRIPHRLASVALAALAGCTRTVPSTEYQTPDVQADIRIDAWSPEETEVWAFLRPAGEEEQAGLYLTMGEGDELWAEAGGGRVRLEARPEGQSWAYQGTLSGPVPDGTVRVAFERQGGASAPESTADLPEPFELDPLPAEVSRAQPLELRWTPAAADPMDIVVSGDCLVQKSFPVPQDRGWIEIPARAIERSMDSKQDSCDAELTIRRSRAGHPDPGLHDGSTVIAAQVRKAQFRSVP